MRRFSNRNQLVTLNEINVTPLLDLAFVLLIIFIITTPVLESSVDLDLPKGSIEKNDPPKKEDIRIVEINSAGEMWLDRNSMTVDQIDFELGATYKNNPKLIVAIRADKNAKIDFAVQILDRCEKHGIDKVSFTTEFAE
ncbi:MAG: ExbD/TolR family protein [Limisphaerales bacterium]